MLRLIQLVLVALLALVSLLGTPSRPAAAAPDRVRVASDGPWLAVGGQRLFVYGVNYQGPADQAWQMWQPDRFDRRRIATDFARMRAGGYNAVRIFVQAPLNADLVAGKYDKLDYVLDQADAHGLRVIVTLADYGENRVEVLAARAGQLAKHYAGRATILAWDLKNEPQFGTFGTAVYPAGQPVPLLDPALVQRYGERRKRSDVATWRRSDGDIPARFTDDEAYVWGNVLDYYREFLRESAAWVGDGSGRSSGDFAATPEGAKWRPFLAALSDTILIWLAPQVEAIKAADGEALVTIGYNNVVLSVQPANQRLQMQSFHRFPALGEGAWRGTFAALDSIQRHFPATPVVLEEFGYSNRTRSGSGVSEASTATHETAVWLELARRGLAGGMKWMLYDFDAGNNPYENAFGALRGDGTPKAAFVAGQALAAHLPGRVEKLDGLNGSSTLTYVARGPGLIVTAGAQRLPELDVSPEAGGLLVARRTAGSHQWVLTATHATTVRLLTGAMLERTPNQVQVLQLDGTAVPSRVEGSAVVVGLPAGATVMVRGATVRPTGRVEPLAGPADQVMYFAETGHNLIYGFRYYWERHGGLAQFGFPITEEFREINPADGKEYTVQYFERARFEYHPEHQGTPYEVELGLLGRQVTAGRESEAPFQGVAAIPDGPEQRFFPSTGHTLRSGFKFYWERHGGLAQFGFPITEEFREINPADGKEYTVQYFERARFEYHPEHQGTPYEVELGLLGRQVVEEGE